ncbi:MAG: hypothetical protein HY023_05275 [Chloroflexi bacterium]|nr:hypothetical protein [Chloroflexota bacterium]MBI3760584.1 hypothetical protein [Chloroflexota bacterium]
MNELLRDYVIDTQHPDVSGIEHLQMLRNRSRLAEIEIALTPEERQRLANADQTLVAHARGFMAELSRFVDLPDERRRLGITQEQWWWYLDVLAVLPAYVIRQPKAEPVLA